MVKRKEQNQVEAILAVVLTVPGFICMASFTRALRRMGLIWEGRVPFHGEENFNTERLGNLSKATQPVRDMDGI